ncbi:MAG: hypothetical protein HFJ80_02580 [Clostridiales bacterium]|nr:hypothetical protein [Clostridiales bacterium]
MISILTVLAMTVCSVPLAAAEPDQEEENGSFVEMADVPGNIRALFAPEELPSSGRTRVSRAGAPEERAALRIVDTDDLNSIRVETPDGEGIAKVFAAPVRYENERGEIEFIDTSMTAENFVASLFTGYDYRNTANSIHIQFSRRPAKGIQIDHLFTLAVAGPEAASLPNGSADQTAEGNGRMVYPRAFGEHTWLEYVNIHTGLKENIVLEENIGTNRFSFVFESAEYIPVLSDDRLTIRVVHSDNQDDIKYQFHLPSPIRKRLLSALRV